MDLEKTRQYYDCLSQEDLCDCAYCQNYIKEIRNGYPELSAFLDSLGVDSAKPFETIPVGPVNETMFYSGAQYVVLGKADDFLETSIGDVQVFITDSHPMTTITEDHFVIEAGPLYLPWSGEESISYNDFR